MSDLSSKTLRERLWDAAEKHHEGSETCNLLIEAANALDAVLRERNTAAGVAHNLMTQRAPSEPSGKPSHAVLTLPECPYRTCDAPLVCLAKRGCRQPSTNRIRPVIDEMIAVAAKESADLDEWSAHCRAQVDQWQSRLQDAVADLQRASATKECSRCSKCHQAEVAAEGAICSACFIAARRAATETNAALACGVDLGFNFKCRRERGHVGPHTTDPKRLYGEEPL